MGPNSLTISIPILRSYGQTCQPLIKENLETLEKKNSGDSTKISEILFFPIKIKQTLFPLEEFTAYLFNNYSSSLNGL